MVGPWLSEADETNSATRTYSEHPFGPRKAAGASPTRRGTRAHESLEADESGRTDAQTV